MAAEAVGEIEPSAGCSGKDSEASYGEKEVFCKKKNSFGWPLNFSLGIFRF